MLKSSLAAAIGLFAALTLSAPASAQDTIGVADPLRIMEAVPQSIAAEQEVLARAAEELEEVRQLEAEFQAAERQLYAEAGTLTDADLRVRQVKLTKMSVELNDRQTVLRRKMNDLLDAKRRLIWPQMLTAIEAVRVERGYTVILQTTEILGAPADRDITDDVIRHMSGN